jgi:hypothetical protein
LSFGVAAFGLFARHGLTSGDSEESGSGSGAPGAVTTILSAWFRLPQIFAAIPRSRPSFGPGGDQQSRAGPLRDYTRQSAAHHGRRVLILTYVLAQVPVVRQMTRIADLYFRRPSGPGARRCLPTRRWNGTPSPWCLPVLVNQPQVGITVKLNFQSRLVQRHSGKAKRPSATYARLVPWAFTYVASGVNVGSRCWSSAGGAG